MAGQQAPLFRPGFRRRIWGLASLAGLLACLAGVAVWQWRWQNRPSVLRLPADSPPPAVSSDPRLTVDTVYRNVRPDVRYVGDQTCAHCHAKITRTYHQHPMGRSLVPVAGRGPGQPDAAIPDAEFQARGFHYQVKPQGNRTVHREMKLDPQGHVIAKTEAEVAFAVGSSTRGRSFLIDHNGYLFQSPITWYPQKGGWDLSPGYASRHHHFARPVTPECLFCHSNRAEHEGGTINHYRPPIFQGYAIGCERCHGPGELHVRRHEQGEASTGPDTTIVNPQNLEPALRDAVCEQCHLQGEIRVPGRGRSSFDYRPGLPLHQFMTVFVSAANSAEASKFVGQVEQMHASRCWNASGGRMGCVSCHDPHQMPAAAERVGFYRDHCLSCHEPNSCTLPAGQRSRVSAQDSCIDCHMPAAKSDIPHASTTDHRIPRRVDHARSEDRNARPAFSRETSLVHFHRALVEPEDPEVARALGIALMDRFERYPEPTRKALGQQALPLLDKAVQRDARDVAALQAKASALWALGRTEEALTELAKALAMAPRQEAAIHSAATLAMELGRPNLARGYWERAVAVNPWRYEFHDGLAAACAQLHDWPAAIAECRQALERNPFWYPVRKLLVRCYLATGAKDQAAAELDLLLAMDPAHAKELREWYAERQE